MHECFFGTKSTHWPSFLSREGGEGLLRGWWWLARIVGKEEGSSANWQDCLHQLGGGYYCRQRRGKKNRGRLSRFQTVAIDARPWSQGLGGLNDQGADRKEGKNNLLDTFHYSPFFVASHPLLSPSSTNFSAVVWLRQTWSSVASLVHPASHKVEAPAIGCRQQGAQGNRAGAAPWQTAKRRR